VVSRLDQLADGVIRPYKNAHEACTVRTILVRNPGITGSNIVVERQLFFELGGFDVKLVTGQDKALALEALLHRVLITTLPGNQVVQREHGGLRQTEQAAKMAEGSRQFTRKYSRHMTDQGSPPEHAEDPAS
jgi:hypothetical protein